MAGIVLMESTVTSDSSTTVFLAYNTEDGAFCCGDNYDPSSEACTNATQGSNQPFNLPPGEVIFNRTDGALLLPNPADPSASPSVATVSHSGATTTVTQTVTGSAATSDAAFSNGKIAAVAAGIAVPLTILFLAAFTACLILARKLRDLRRTQQPPGMAQHTQHDVPVQTTQSPISPMSRGSQYMFGSVAGPPVYKGPVTHQQIPLSEAPADTPLVESDSRAV